jgi:hypothetical protein
MKEILTIKRKAAAGSEPSEDDEPPENTTDFQAARAGTHGEGI